jgi:hypothetical protein
MLSSKDALGLLSLAITAAAYTVYIWQTAHDRDIQPHPVSWFLFGLATTVAFLAQRVRGGGPGSWVTAITALVCFVISGLSFFKHSWSFSWSDGVSAAFTGIALFAFFFAKSPMYAAVFATSADIAGYYPTIKKGWHKPFNDSVTSFTLNSAKFVPALFALESYSVATWLYPATLVVMNVAVASGLLVRRKQFMFPETAWSPRVGWLCWIADWRPIAVPAN